MARYRNSVCGPAAKSLTANRTTATSGFAFVLSRTANQFNAPKGQDEQIKDNSSFLNTPDPHRKVDCEHKGFPCREAFADAISALSIRAQAETFAFIAYPQRWQ